MIVAAQEELSEIIIMTFPSTVLSCAEGKWAKKYLHSMGHTPALLPTRLFIFIQHIHHYIIKLLFKIINYSQLTTGNNHTKAIRNGKAYFQS